MSWVVFVLLIILVVIVIRMSNLKENGIFYPPAFFAYLVILGFIIPYPIVLSMGDQNFFYLFWNYTYTNYDKAMLQALAAGFIALLFFFVGFRISEKKATQMRDWPIFSKSHFYISKTIFQPFLLLTFFICIVLLLIRIVQVGGVQNYFGGNENRVEFMQGNNIFSLIQNCFAGVYLYWFSLNVKKGWSLKNILFLLSSLFLLLANNSKSPIFVLFFSLLIIYYYRVKRFSYFQLFITSFLAMFVFIFWELLFREYFVAGEFVSLNNGEALLTNLLFRFGDFFVGNFMQLQTTSIIIDSYPAAHSFLMGSSLLMVVLIFLPRVIFPWKPYTGAGELTLTLWPERFDENGTTLPPGLIGELYMNFSWYGIILGMLLVGFLYGLLWKRFKYNVHDTLYSFVLVIMLALMLHFFRGEVSSPFLLGVFFILPSALLSKVLSRA